MKNTVKMSLAAALAVSALSTTASAQALEDAIKGVDVSGTMVYRYQDFKSDATDTTANENYYKIGMNIKSPVNDMVTANVRVLVADGEANFAKLDAAATADVNPGVTVSQANFAANVAGATIIAGKQGLDTPWTVAIDSDSEEQTGTGLLAIVPVGPVTLAAGYFNQTNLNQNLGALTDGSDDVAVVAAMAKVGPVALDAWYLDLDNVFDTYTIGAKADVEGVSVEARYTSLDLEDSISTADNALYYVKVGAKVGPLGLKAAYGATDKDGGTVAVDNDAKTDLKGFNLSLGGHADSDMYMVSANMDIASGLNLAVAYDDLSNDSTNQEFDETYATLTYKMSKNLKSYVRYGVRDNDGTDIDEGRLQIEYKF